RPARKRRRSRSARPARAAAYIVRSEAPVFCPTCRWDGMASNATLTHERAETPALEGLPADPQPWRAAVLLGIAAVAAGLLWPIYGAYGMALCIPMLYALRRFVRAAWERAGLGDPGALTTRSQIAVAAVGFPSALIYYGHYEDVLAYAFIMLALVLAWRNRWS